MQKDHIKIQRVRDHEQSKNEQIITEIKLDANQVRKISNCTKFH